MRRSPFPAVMVVSAFAACSVFALEVRAEQDDEVAERVAEASAEEGEELANTECVACHTFEQDQPHGAGPNLWDVVMRPIAGVEDFEYSDALEEQEGEWSYENLDGFISNPNEWAPGTTMAYPGLEDEQDRANVIAYLRTLSDDPAPLPDDD